MKIALVHDYLREYGGAERVLEALHEMYPDAPLYTSFVDFPSLGKHADRFKNWDIRTSWVQNNPFIKKFISPLRFLAPKIWSSFDLSGFDVVISSSGWFMCRGVALQKSEYGISNVEYRKDINNINQTSNFKPQTSKHPIHICYIHHPPRNLYGYATGSNLEKYPLVRVYAALVNHFLRKYDFQTAQKVDYFIANSKETARRVEKFYRRDSTVIYPPIDIRRNSKFQIPNSKKEYYLSVGRLSWAKRVDVIIEACNVLKAPLNIIGTGKEESYLRSIAGPTIEFVGSVSDEELACLYEGAKALLFCALDEDFGMVPVEAMSHGTPVIALVEGGVKETVIDGKTGVLFANPTKECLTQAIGKFSGNKKQWEKECKLQAQTFDSVRFKKEMKLFIQTHASRNY